MSVLLIATPTYDGKVTCAYANSLLKTFTALALEGHACTVDFRPHDAIIEYARNILVARFLRTTAEALLFVDADIGWPAQAVMTLLNSPYDVVGGVYPKKERDLKFPVHLVRKQAGESYFDDTGFVEAQYLPTGFMLVRRHVFEEMAPNLPTYYDAGLDQQVTAFFECRVLPGGFVGEDVDFCNRYRLAGGKIWCWPDIDFEHAGTWHWGGNFKHYLTENWSTNED